ncbi:MAG: GntR family transcriptional regulator [Anaerolineae bacterium]|nr:GntR family transcriptional regulator [Anaerolineae bacterium]
MTMREVVRPPTLTETVATAIQEAILRGDLRPGEPLHEVELSKNLNTSRGTVREALRLLQREGLVEVFVYRGAFVTELSPRRIWEIYTLRAKLEPYALRLALEAKACTPEDLAGLKNYLHKMGESERSDDYQGLITADMDFHCLLASRSGHALLINMLDNLRTLTLLFILNTKLYRSDMVADEVSHQAILDVILTGDPEAAEATLARHITDSGTSLLRRMAEVGMTVGNPLALDQGSQLTRT